ncbi:MAG: hypothetical protein KF893_02005 [Caldilineaceae bacterium]|nr:hypothetical protein [Caldilineaceae bacterium]
MSNSLQIVVVIVLYLILFGWVGYRRGSLREFIVFIVALGGYLILRRYQNIVVTVVNLGGRFYVFAREGGLTGEDPNAILALRDAPNLIVEQQADTLIFLIWVVILLLTYVITGRFVRNGRNRSDAIAILLGIVNGIFYFSIFLPLLASIFVPEVVAGVARPQDGAGFVLRRTFSVINDSFGNIWGTLDGQQPLVIALFLTLVLVAIANTLRAPGAKGKT